MNGFWADVDVDIANEAISYFSDLFSEPVRTASDLLHLIPPMVTREDNLLLEAISSMEEAKRVVFEMDGDSVASPDGFVSKFFTFALDVLVLDVYNAVVSFFFSVG